MKNYLMTIQYDGTRYSGWQRQGNTGNTIENKLCEVLSKMIFNRYDVEIHGSGRTDAGVHAKGQKANVKLSTDYTEEEIKTYMNKYLPADISVLDIEIVPDRFHARLLAKEKIYEYSIDVSQKADVFLRKYSWNIYRELNIDLMKNAALCLMGEHDFRGFSDMKKDRKSSVRTIYNIEITKKANLIKIRYTGDGFLYHMVRKLTAFLVDVGLGISGLEDIQVIFDTADKSAYKKMAPAQGLCLLEVHY